MNKIILLAILTKEVEIKTFASGSVMGVLNVVVNNRTKKGNIYVDEPCYLEAKVFGKMADYVQDYTSKGSQILLEGKITQETWNDNQGNKKSKYVIICESINILDNKKQTQDNPSNAKTSKAPKEIVTNDDEIPF